jgi:hypothetical protein
MQAQNEASSVYEVQDGTGGPPSPWTPDELPLVLAPLDEPPEDVPDDTPDDAPEDAPVDDAPLDEVLPDELPDDVLEVLPDVPPPDEPPDESCVAPPHAYTHQQNSAVVTALRRTPRPLALVPMTRAPL